MSKKIKSNKNYKDTVFRLLFGEIDKSAELYNSIHNTNYTPDMLKMNTLQNPLYYGGFRNDLSFSVDNKLVSLYEHQSTLSPNICLRFLLYAADIYKQLIQTNIDDLYKTTPMSIETPEFVVLYNGEAKYPEKDIVKLSDLYRVKDGRAVNLEITATIYNVKKGHNHKLMKRSKTLSEYAVFVDKVQKYKDKKYDSTDAMNRAVEECVKENILKEFLIRYGGEIVSILNMEWNLNDALRVRGEEKAEEKAEEIAENLLRKGISKEIVIESTKLSIEKIEEIIKKINADK